MDSLAAVLWDMDGTLVDTEPYWITAEHELVQAHGGQWSDEQGLALVGNDLTTSAEVIRAAGVDLPVEVIVQHLLTRVAEQVRQEVPWRPGAVELLTQLRQQQVRCALVTMSWTLLAEAVAQQLPADSFEFLVTGDVVQAGKPDPECYLLACAKLGVAPADCVALEDSNTGARAALAAGVPTIAVKHLVDFPDRPGQLIQDTLAGADLATLTGWAKAARASW